MQLTCYVQGPYLVVFVINFIFRIAYINKEGQCIIGMKKVSMIPLIAFDVLVNVYLTILFILPLRQLYSYKHNTRTAAPASAHPLRKVALRTFVGSCATLTSSVVNLTVLMVLEGEPGWVCLMCCNADILFSVVVLHWVTAIDSSSRYNSSANAHAAPGISQSHRIRSGVNDKWAISSRQDGMKPTVTTHIAGGGRAIHDEETNKRGAEVHVVSDGYAMDRINVHTHQIRDIEFEDGRKSDGTSNSDTFGGRNNSTDQIVEG